MSDRPGVFRARCIGATHETVAASPRKFTRMEFAGEHKATLGEFYAVIPITSAEWDAWEDGASWQLVPPAPPPSQGEEKP